MSVPNNLQARWRLTAVGAVAATVLGWWLTTPAQAAEFQRWLAYPLALVALFGGGWAYLRVARGRRQGGWPWGRAWALGAFVAVSLATIYVQTQSGHGYRTLLDEPVILATAQSIHLERQATVGTILQTELANAYVEPGTPDKRPVLFATLVAILHDLTGYRIGNAFILNGLLTWVFFGLLFVIAARGARTPWGGLVAIFLWTELPLVHHQFTGAGFELLNLVLLLAWLWVARRAIVQASLPWLGVLCWVTILLTYTRYEGALMVLPTAIVVGWTLWRRQSWELPPVTPALPWLCLPTLWVMKIIQINPEASLQIDPAQQSAFGLSYIVPNLSEALRYFFASDSSVHQSSLPLAVVGLVGTVLWLLAWRRWSWRGDGLLTLWLGVIGLYFALLMVYFWGNLDNITAIRLVLPIYLALTLLAVVGWARISCWLPSAKARQNGWWIVAVLAFATIPAVGAPAIARRYLQVVPLTSRMATAVVELAEREGRGIIVISQWPALVWPHRIMQVPFAVARQEASGLRLFWQEARTRGIWVIQEGQLVNRQFVAHPEQEIPADWPLAEVEVIPTGLDFAIRIARVDFPSGLPPAWQGPTLARRLPTSTTAP